MSDRNILFVVYLFSYLLILTNQLLITKTSRKDVLLGIKIPEIKREDQKVKLILSGYYRSTIIIGIIGLFILSFINYKYYENIIILMFTPILYLILLFIVFLTYNKKIKDLKEEEDWFKNAKNIKIVDFENIETENINKFLVIPGFILITNLLLVYLNYENIPNKIAVKYDFKGNVLQFANKNIYSVNIINMTHIILVLSLYFIILSIVRSKGKIDYNNISQSKENIKTFKNIWTRFNYYSFIIIQIILSYMNLYMLGYTNNIQLFNKIILLYSLFMVLINIYLSFKLGQSGDNIKYPNKEVNNYYIMEDDKYWILGNTIYYNKNDANLFVEKRVGVGWTINIGHFKGKLIIGFLLIVLLIIIYIVNRSV